MEGVLYFICHFYCIVEYHRYCRILYVVQKKTVGLDLQIKLYAMTIFFFLAFMLRCRANRPETGLGTKEEVVDHRTPARE